MNLRLNQIILIIEYGGLHAFLISRWGNNRIKGVNAVLKCGCDAVFHWNGVLYKNSDQLWLVHCINIRRVFGSTLNPRPRAQTTFSSLGMKTMVDPFNMYLKIFIELNASLSPYRKICYFILLNHRSHSSTMHFCVAY